MPNSEAAEAMKMDRAVLALEHRRRRGRGQAWAPITLVFIKLVISPSVVPSRPS
jgi:hypothetical protein